MVGFLLVAADWLAGTGAVHAASGGPTVIQGAMEIGPVAPGVFQGDLRHLPWSREWQPGDPVVERPRPTYPRPPTRELAPLAPEPAVPPVEPVPRADEAARRLPDSRAFTTPILNFDAATFTGVNPPDPVGDVGPNHFIHMVNQASGSQVRIYDKSGTLLAEPFTLSTLWTAGGACATGLGDPIVLYDPLADRWLMSEFASTGSHLCVYVSQTADPVSGGWFLYDFPTPQFPDYPKYAVWPDAYYVSTNESTPAVYALDRTRMLAGLSATAQRFTGPDLAGFPFQAFTPADLDGATPPPAGAAGLFMRHRDDEAHNPPGTAQDFLEIWEFHVDFVTPANSTFTGPTNIAVAEFSSELCGLSSFSCFPQPSGVNALDPLREVIMFRLQYRNFGTHQTLVGNFVTDADGEGGGDPLERGGIRWFELRKVGAGVWSLFQEGTHSPDTDARWMGAIAMDGAGNIALGYSVSSGSVFPSLRYAGRLAGDPAGTLQAEVSLVAGTASNGSNRWGDYAAMSVDPADDCTFWFTSLYSPTSQWRTRIGVFRFDSCQTPPTVQDIPDQATNEDTPLGPIAFTVGDVETPAASLTVSGSSSNPTLVPTTNIGFGGSGASRTVTLTPAPNQFGTTTITITVSDGSLTASDTFVLTVTAVNDPPTISDLPDQATNENTPLGPIAFTVGDGETPAGGLTVSGSSSNPTLVPTANIGFGGSGASRTVTLTPAPNQFGTTTVTITVSDGSLTASDTFLLTVTAVNDPPIISDLPDQATNEDTPIGPIGFTVGDGETPAGGLTVSGSSSNPTLVPTANIGFGGSGASRTVTLTPAPNQFGTTTVTITVSDGSLTASDTFLLTVNAAPIPKLSLSLNQAVFQSGQTLTVSATLMPGTDPPTPVDAYVVVQLPTGAFLSIQLNGSVVPGVVPLASGFIPFPVSVQLLAYTFTGGEPLGTYTRLSALTQAGTLNVIGSIEQDLFTFAP